MVVPCDLVVTTADLMTLRHKTPPTYYRRIGRLYTAYLRATGQLQPGQVADAAYLLQELERGQVTALVLNERPHLRLVGLTTGRVLEYREALVVCINREVVANKYPGDGKFLFVRRELLQKTCLQFVAQHYLHASDQPVPEAGLGRKVLWRPARADTFTAYQWRDAQLVQV